MQALFTYLKVQLIFSRFQWYCLKDRRMQFLSVFLPAQQKGLLQFLAVHSSKADLQVCFSIVRPCNWCLLMLSFSLQFFLKDCFTCRLGVLLFLEKMRSKIYLSDNNTTLTWSLLSYHVRMVWKWKSFFKTFLPVTLHNDAFSNTIDILFHGCLILFNPFQLFL